MTGYKELARVDAAEFPFRARCLTTDCHMALAPMIGQSRAYCEGCATSHVNSNHAHTVVIEERVSCCRYHDSGGSSEYGCGGDAYAPSPVFTEGRGNA